MPTTIGFAHANRMKPLSKKESELARTLRKQLGWLQKDLAYHKDVLERFQQSSAWRLTGPVRYVVNMLRRFGGSRSDTLSLTPADAGKSAEHAADSRRADYFTGLCDVSLENFQTSGATLETLRLDHPEIAAILKELAANEREIEHQKWVFERFLESPAWRWTAPIRWAVSQLPGFGNGHPVARPPARENTPDTVEEAESAAIQIKTYFTGLCREELENFLASGALLELPQSEHPTISIILVLSKRAELTLACLRSIVRHCAVDSELVIVDNDSNDETRQLLDRLRGARIVRSPNRPFLDAANHATSECRGEFLLFLNSDAQLLPDAVQNALRVLQSSPEIGAVGGRIIFLDGTLQEAGSIVWKDGLCTGYGRGDEPFAPMYCFRRDVDYCSVFLLTPRRVWDNPGGFDAAFDSACYEMNYCMRLWERGLRVVYEPSATIIHYAFGSPDSNPTTEAVIRARSRNAERRILAIDDRVPHLWLGSGFPRANVIHQALRRLGYFVTFYPLDVIVEPWDQVYSDFPNEVEVMLGSGRDLLETFLASRKGYYSTIIISRPHNMKLLAPVRKAHPDWFEGVDVIYDAEAVFVQREIGLRQLSGRPMTEQEISIAMAEEIQLAAAADRVITVSGSDRQTFLTHGIGRVDVLGHSIDPVAGDVPFDSRHGFLFVGAIHEEPSPNADALMWFLREIFPRIQKKLGDIPVTIAGVNRSKRIRDLAVPPICITGHLPSLSQLYLQSRVFVAPTRYAAGIPHKVHEAAACGIPVVATPLLARQLGWSDCELGIAGDSESFAEMCIQIYTDESRWTTLRDAALKRVTLECSPKRFEQAVRQ